MILDFQTLGATFSSKFSFFFPWWEILTEKCKKKYFLNFDAKFMLGAILHKLRTISKPIQNKSYTTLYNYIDLSRIYDANIFHYSFQEFVSEKKFACWAPFYSWESFRNFHFSKKHNISTFIIFAWLAKKFCLKIVKNNFFSLGAILNTLTTILKPVEN